MEPKEFKLRNEFSNRDIATEMSSEELGPGEILKRVNFNIYISGGAALIAVIAIIIGLAVLFSKKQVGK